LEADRAELIERLKLVAEAQLAGDAPFLSALGLAIQDLGARVDTGTLSGTDGRNWAAQLLALARGPRGLSALERLGRASIDPTKPPGRPEAADVDLRRVVHIGQELQHVGAVRVQTLELYDNTVVVTWAKPLGDGESEPTLVWSLWDDKGTDYDVIAARGGGDGRGTWRGEVIFTPGLPSSAYVVHIALNGVDIPVALDA